MSEIRTTPASHLGDTPQFPGRFDLALVAEMIEPGSRVLDIGCADGSLLRLLETTRSVDGRGIELSQSGVNECVTKGLAVVQGDADHDLVDYPANAFDYVVLSQTLQATYDPRGVLEHLLRIGRHAIVSFPNFGYWRLRRQVAFGGRMPVSAHLPCAWYETPNIHFCTIKDFVALAEDIGAEIEGSAALDGRGNRLSRRLPLALLNLLGEQAIFLLRRGNGAGTSRRPATPVA